ncbi:MAG: hypothetical protein Q9184_008041, partial [Pyrenodesmia sp. 2 TL-2023]
MSTSGGSSVEDSVRITRLNTFFHSVNKGERSLKTTQDGNRYIEALCQQSDPSSCIDHLVHSLAGMSALQRSLQFDLSESFFNGPASDLLGYLQHPDLESLLQGSLLREVLVSISEKRLFWDALVRSHGKEELLLPAQLSFGWLLIHLMCLPEPQCKPFYQLAQEPKIQDSFLKSQELQLRTIGSQIRHILSTSPSSANNTAGESAGGRHDNDFADFRHVAILPTADELVSKDPPFLRLAETLEDPELAEDRLAMHLDNQFRLYREDMLGELREEIQIALGQKKGRHRGIVLDNLTLLGID